MHVVATIEDDMTCPNSVVEVDKFVLHLKDREAALTMLIGLLLLLWLLRRSAHTWCGIRGMCCTCSAERTPWVNCTPFLLLSLVLCVNELTRMSE